MCGRFTQLFTWAEIWDISQPWWEAPVAPPRRRHNLAPTQQAMILRVDDGVGAATEARWGFMPSWRSDGDTGPAPINARSETAASSRLFGPSMKRRRCVVPVSGFYEWQERAGEKARQPWYIFDHGAPALLLAGLWSRWRSDEGEAVESFTILTCPANDFLRPIHNAGKNKHRMPVALSSPDARRWLEPDELDPQTLTDLLASAGDRAFDAHEVSTHVNSPRHDDPRCIEPLTPGEGLFG